MLDLMLCCCILKFWTIFEGEASCFHYVPSPVNYAVALPHTLPLALHGCRGLGVDLIPWLRRWEQCPLHILDASPTLPVHSGHLRMFVEHIQRAGGTVETRTESLLSWSLGKGDKQVNRFLADHFRA